jgi:membrane protease YdiL (CAAX protease family)
MAGAVVAVSLVAFSLEALCVYSLASSPTLKAWLLFGAACCLAILQAVLPFALARGFPRVAAFDARWFPEAWWHWIACIGMVVVVIFGAGLGPWLAGRLGLWSPRFRISPTAHPIVTPGLIAFHATAAIGLAPVGEELFWRGYVLDQLRKLMRSSAALVVQSVLFALVHVGGGFPSVSASFVCAVVLGSWRISFRSLVPLMLAHILLNAAATVPQLAALGIRTKPSCQEIDRLTSEPVQRAVPSIIGLLGDSDPDVQFYATVTLATRYRKVAEPYLREALRSRDERLLMPVLGAISYVGCAGLKEEVRKVAWSVADRDTQMAAVLTLAMLEDKEGLVRVSQEHPKDEIRKTAAGLLGKIKGEKQRK